MRRGKLDRPGLELMLLGLLEQLVESLAGLADVVGAELEDERRVELHGCVTPWSVAVRASIDWPAQACRTDGPGSRTRARPRSFAPPAPCARCPPGAP